MNEFNWTYVAVVVLGLFGLFSFLATVVLSLTWYERKLLARIQMRVGPSRVGPHGLLQPIADVFKLVTKEDIRPTNSSGILFWSAPLIVFVSAFLSGPQPRYALPIKPLMLLYLALLTVNVIRTMGSLVIRCRRPRWYTGNSSGSAAIGGAQTAHA